MENVSTDLGDLDGYAGKTAGVANDLDGATSAHLANQTVGSDMLGDLGEESGLHSHLSSRIGAVHHAAKTSSEYVASLGHAVGRARTDYQHDEELHAQSFRRIDRD